MLQRLLACVVASLLWLATAAFAQDVLPVPPLSGRVVDQTGTLTPAQAQALTAKLEAIEKQRGAQLVVLIVPTTQPEDIATYGQRVADTWKVGRRDVGDGLVVVVAKNDRRINIEVAKTLEGAVPDVLAGRIINDQIKPAFRANDYAGGLNAAIDRLDKAIGGEALPAPTGKGGGNANRGPFGGFDIQDLAIFLFVAVPIVGALLTAIFGRKLGALVTGGAVGAVAWFLTASLLVAGGAGLIALILIGVMGVGSG
ncbi:MAG: TPM domain-containing protein, partial [Burkholderiaceae bacterium]